MPRTFQDLVKDALSRIREVQAPEVMEKLRRSEATLLLDVREGEEVARGKIAGAVCIPRGVLEGQAQQLLRDPAAEIVVYCGSGMRSALAADTLQRLGYTNVRSMAGGFREWTRLGGPTERP